MIVASAQTRYTIDMRGWSANIEAATTSNSTFRTVVFTGKHMQLTVMSIEVGEEIGLEVHEHIGQFLRVE